jgi:hypothetical protein
MNAPNKRTERLRAVAAAMAADATFRGFNPIRSGEAFESSIPWQGREIRLEVSSFNAEGVATLAGRCQELLAALQELDAEARALVLEAAGDPDSNLARWRESPAEEFVATLDLSRLTVNDAGEYSLTYLAPLLGGIKLIAGGYAGEGMASLAVRGVGLKRGRMPLMLAGDAYAIESAKLGLFINTESWDEATQLWVYGPRHLRANYSLEIQVDKDSGEDGAPFPMAQTIPVRRRSNGFFPLPADLSGITVRGDEGWEAWLGNDAPPIMANQLTFGGYQEGRVGITWTGEYGFHSREPFVFDGDAAIDHVGISVKAEEDADAFMTQLFGAERLASLRREVGEWQTYGESMPENRRRWMTVKYFFT